MAPYVGKSLVYKIVDSMTVSIDNILEYEWKKNERYSCQLCIKNTCHGLAGRLWGYGEKEDPGMELCVDSAFIYSEVTDAQ